MGLGVLRGRAPFASVSLGSFRFRPGSEPGPEAAPTGQVPGEAGPFVGPRLRLRGPYHNIGRNGARLEEIRRCRLTLGNHGEIPDSEFTTLTKLNTTSRQSDWRDS